MSVLHLTEHDGKENITVIDPELGQGVTGSCDGPPKHRCRVGKYSVELTYDRWGQRIATNWQPSFPKRLTKRELNQYKDGRNVLMQHVADLTGGRVMVIDL